MNLKQKIKLGGVLLAIPLGLMILLTFFNWEKVEGNERLVTQNFSTGVSEDIVGPGTFFYFPITTTVYKYNVGSEKFIMGKKELYSGVGQDEIDYPAFTITTGGSGNEQPATFSVTLQYHLNPAKLVALHNTAQSSYDDLIIKPALTRIISDQSTQLKVLDFYSGVGRVNLQKSIEQAITEHSALSDAGIIVDTFVIDDISLDNEYVEKIRGRQLAFQDKLKSIEEAKAAKEKAKKVEAEAEANKLKLIVEAEAKKQQQIKAAEAQSEQVKLQAEADRFRKEQDAKGQLALGTAEAKVAELKRDSKYAGQSGLRAAKVEIEKARVELFKNMNLKGIVPEGTVLTIIEGLEGKNSPQLTLPAK